MSRLFAPLATLAQEFTPSNGIEMYSDFVGDASPFSICTGTAASVNSGTFVLTNTLADKAFGEIAMTLPGIQGARIGVFAGTVGAFAGTYSNSTFGIGNVNGSVVDRQYLFTDMPYDFEARVVINSFPTALQKLCVGFAETHAGASTTLHVSNGAAFTAVGGGNWQCVVAAAGTMSTTSTSYSSGTYQKLRITTDPTSNTIQFFINDQLVRSAAPTWDTANSFLIWGVEAREKGVTGSLASGLFKIDYMRLVGRIQR
jgi:hypothetical protein